jgi:hypothetical protein
MMALLLWARFLLLASIAGVVGALVWMPLSDRRE